MRILKYLVIILIVLGGLYLLSWRIDLSRGEPSWGVTFSEFYTKETLKLDWKKVYLAILDDLNPKKLRLIAYWQYLEPKKGEFDFADLDFQIKEAQKRDKEIVLTAGERVPRWPECHFPEWVKNLSAENREKEVLAYLQEIINHYKSFSAIKIWQIENEPLLTLFGNCPSPARDFLKKEIGLVKSLDARPVMITDSGELSTWTETAGLSDILGTTLYRIVWSPYVGWFREIYPPVFYSLRAELVKLFSKTKNVIVSELQAEPWGENQKSIIDVPFDRQVANFSVQDFKNTAEFAKKTGLKEIYFWGPEWWYYRKINNDNAYWEAGKEIIKRSAN